MSKKEFNIPFSPPDISENEIDLVVDALKSGWITTGPKTKEFEEVISDFVGTNKTATMNSATACMEMMLRLFDVGPGDEVITSAYTYTSSASVIDHIGAKIVLVDTEPDSFFMDLDKLEESITDKTKVIIPVDIAGVPANYDGIKKVLEQKKDLYSPTAGSYQEAFDRVIILADAAHSLGAKYKGQMVGQVSDFTSFSFHAVKNLTTAEGGALTWVDREGLDNGEIYEKLMQLILHGQTKDALAKNQLGSWEYDIVAPYFKANMTDVHAAIGLSQMNRYQEMLDRRHEIIQKYELAFSDLPVTTIKHLGEDYYSSGHLYLMRIDDYGEKERNEFIVKMAEAGIATNVHYKPLPMMTAYKNLGFDIKDYPNAYNMYKNEVTLPLYSSLTDDEVDYIISSVRYLLS